MSETVTARRMAFLAGEALSTLAVRGDGNSTLAVAVRADVSRPLKGVYEITVLLSNGQRFAFRCDERERLGTS